jgi:hypothetical protein
MVATVPVNAGSVGTGAVVAGATGAIVVVVDDAVVDGAVVVATVVAVVVELDRRTTARLGDEEPHAPVASTINTANARTRGRGSTGS